MNQLTIKEKLKDYNDLIQEISNIKSKIQKLDGKDVLVDVVQSSSKHFPYVKRNIVIENPQPKLIQEKEQYKQLLEKKAKKLIKKKIEIETFIDSLPTSRLRNIFELKYIQGYSYKMIAYKLGVNTTEESVRKEHDRFFEKK